jgi:hypothetical protein
MEAAALGRSHLLVLEELLVTKRCNSNYVNDEGFCALHSATFNGHLMTVKLLMRCVRVSVSTFGGRRGLDE